MHPASATRIPKDKSQFQKLREKKKILTGYRIEGPHFVQVGKRQDDFIVHGNTAPYQARISTLRHDTNTVLVAPFHDFTYFLG